MPFERVQFGAVILAMALSACGGGSGGSMDASHGDGAPGDVAATTVTSLTVDPPTSTVTLMPGGTAMVSLHATAHYASGSTADVTSMAHWSTASPGAAVAQGTVSITASGQLTVQATLGSAQATGTILATVSGDFVLPGAPANAGTLLGATPGSSVPHVAYPLDGALFPANLGTAEFQIQSTDPSQSLVRVAFTGDAIALNLIGPCHAITSAPGGATVAGGCGITIPEALVPSLAGASELANMSVRVRLVAADGSHLAESAAMSVRWTRVPVTGGLYYWNTSTSGTTQINQFNLDDPTSPPVVYFTDNDSPPLGYNPDGQATAHPCMGCHAISRDGTTIALTFGGSDPSNYGVFSIATRAPIAVENTGTTQGFATMTAFSPDARYLIAMYRGQFTLRQVDVQLTAVMNLFGTGIDPNVTHPFWSADGSTVVFTGWVPDAANPSTNGDLATGGRIYLSSVTGGTTFGTPRVLVDRAANTTSFYPAISDDTQYVVFDRSTCSGTATTGYGASPCDGYNDTGARLMLTTPAGGAPVDLANLNGTQAWTNSWPRWAPDHGTFQGAGLYWIAFSNRRPYGLRLPGSTDGTTKPQLWFGAIRVTPGAIAIDPSFAPIWLPGQDTDMNNPTGNHVPQWVDTAVTIMTPG